jgi:anti-sigma factor RsiW
MSEMTPPIQEDDLHAYIDNQLDAGRRLAVERYLDANPEAARRVAIYKEQRDLLRAAFATHAGESTPGKLSVAHIIAERNRQRPQAWLFAASVASALGIGLAGGWLLHAAQVPGRTQQAMAFLEQEALTSHVVYALDGRHPVEVPGSETPHLQQWLSKRLDRSVVAPDLSSLGYHLIGGRLLATEHGGAAALLMYDNDTNHQRISLLLRPMASALHAPDVPIEQGGVNGRAWIANGLGVAVVADVPAADIARLATQIGVDLGPHG